MYRILLLCNAGMSTGLVMKKMKEAAQKKELEVEIDAKGVEEFDDSLEKYDIFLLGPQVRFKKAELSEKAKKVNKIVETIDTLDYGMMRGESILDFALELLKK